MTRDEAFGASVYAAVVGFSIVVGIVAACFGIGLVADLYGRNETKRITVCVKSGGEWLYNNSRQQAECKR